MNDQLASLKPLFEPRSVAIVGASATPGKQGNAAMRYLVSGGFEGAIYPVNPAGGTIEGLPTYRSVLDVPGEIDCALFVIPAAMTLEAVRDCARKGVRGLIVGSNGFAELGTPEGHTLQAELTRLAQEHGMRILGPNTNGIWNANARFSLGYNTSHGDAMIAGPVSIVAHSGALFNSIAPTLRRFGVPLSKFVPVGNEADTDLLDFLDYFIADPDTKIIGLIMEAVRDGERLRRLSAAARAAGKPIIALKLGRSRAGAGAAMAHSSRMAGNFRAYESFLDSCGIPRTSSIESLAAACALLVHGVPDSRGPDRSLICVSTSGGGAEIIADHAEEFAIPLAGEEDGSWSGAAAEVIAGLGGAGPIRNPIDGGNLAGWGRLAKIFEALEADRVAGPVLFFSHMLPQATMDRQVAEMLIANRTRTNSPLIYLAPGGLRDEIRAYLEANTVPIFADTHTCFTALRCLYTVMKPHAADNKTVSPAGLKEEIAALIGRASGPVLDEIISAMILSKAGVPLVQSTEVATVEDALSVLSQHRSPIVLKGIVSGIAHKNDAGLVAVSLRTADDVQSAFARLSNAIDALQASGPRRLIAQPMLASRLELLAGVTYEPPLGHFLVFGLGGVHAEIFQDVQLIPIPCSPRQIEAAIMSSKAGQILASLDRPQANLVPQVAQTLNALQWIVLSSPETILSIDVNPLLIGEKTCTAVDALVILREREVVS